MLSAPPARMTSAAPLPIALRSALRTRIAAYKIPKHIEFPAALPRTTSGKVLRRTLRERMIQSPDV